MELVNVGTGEATTTTVMMAVNYVIARNIRKRGLIKMADETDKKKEEVTEEQEDYIDLECQWEEP